MKNQITTVRMIVSLNGRYTFVSCTTYGNKFEEIKSFVKNKGNFDTIEITDIISYQDKYAEYHF